MQQLVFSGRERVSGSWGGETAGAWPLLKFDNFLYSLFMLTLYKEMISTVYT